MICVLLGPPCSGKTTLGDGLSQRLGLPHVLASAELKGLDGSTSSEHGDAVQVGVIMARLRRPDCANGCILDNFPRNAKQAQILEENLQQLFKTGATHVLDLEVPTRTLEARAAARMVDQGTGLPIEPEECQGSARELACITDLETNVTYCIPSDVQRDAAVHESLLLRRADDSPERFQRRLERYADHIASLRQFYKNKRCLCTALDGAQPKQEIFGQAFRALNASEEVTTNDLIMLSPRAPQNCQELRLPAESARDQFSDMHSKFQHMEKILQQVFSMLDSFFKGVQSNSTWNTQTLRKPCGCKTETKKYIGADPPTNEVRKLLGDCAQLLATCRSALWEAREAHLRKQYGDVSPWLSWLLVSCCMTTSQIETLQRTYNSLDRRVTDARNLLTRSSAQTATQTSTAYCAAHIPQPMSIGSP